MTKRVDLRSEQRRLGGYNPLDPALVEIAAAHGDDDRLLKRAFGLAILVHLVFLVVTLPAEDPEVRDVARDRAVYVMQQVRFKQPPPREERQIPERKAKKVPIPDPTPDGPEPIVRDELVEVDLDVPESDLVFTVPDAPPSLGRGGDGPVEIAGNVQPPVKIHAPQPLFTEEARTARVEGVVILQTIIDAMGEVSDIQILKGLPYGLTESAVETVSQWRFEPARLEGEPVSVYYMLTITFRIQ